MKFAVLAVALLVAAPFQVAAQTTTSSADMQTTSAKAKGKGKKDGKKGKKAAKENAAVKPAGNANCPVGGAPVGSMQAGSHFDYKGYRVGLCCDGCKAKFNSDPDAYLSKALAR